MNVKSVLLSASLFGIVFLLIGIWFAARIDAVASFDLRLSKKLRLANRKPQIGGRAYRIMFRLVGVLLALTGAALLVMVVVAVLRLTR